MEEVQARHSEERQEALRQLVGYQRPGGERGVMLIHNERQRVILEEGAVSR